MHELWLLAPPPLILPRPRPSGRSKTRHLQISTPTWTLSKSLTIHRHTPYSYAILEPAPLAPFVCSTPHHLVQLPASPYSWLRWGPILPTNRHPHTHGWRDINVELAFFTQGLSFHVFAVQGTNIPSIPWKALRMMQIQSQDSRCLGARIWGSTFVSSDWPPHQTHPLFWGPMRSAD